MRTARAAWAFWMAAGVGCVDGGSGAQVSGRHEAIVYGADDRRDVHEVSDAKLASIAQHSVVALVLENQILRPAAGGLKLLGDTLADTRTQIEPMGSYFPMCPGEPFLDQPVLADCTGVLIDDDLVLTAAHCFSEDRPCDNYLFVFDFFERASGELETVTTSDVYGCGEVVAERLSADPSGSKIDYAVVRLDRAPTGRRPVEVRSTVLKQDEPLSTIGYPVGLPAKIDQGGKVIDARVSTRDFFFLDSDTFKGSSGSGVFDEAHRLAGLLVRGGADFVMAPGEQCLIANVVATDGGMPPSTWEEATYVKRAVDALCQLGYPTERLCNIAPRCGDDFCTSGESVDTCASDCDAETCWGASCSKARDLPTLGETVDEPTDAGMPGEDDAGAPPASSEPGGCSVAPTRRPMPFFSPLLGLFVARRRRTIPRAR